MIPPDVASSLRSVLTESQSATQQPQQTQPVAATQRIADVLGNLVPGQRIMAEIQGMQANGTYRATVGQREITLSLPFSAKTGDSLELEVTESEGKLTLAFVANRGEPASKGQPVSVATSLSNTGRMIGDLLQELTVDGKRAPAAPLNGNQALVQNMPKDAAQLVPVLKQALTQSGMFYEAHQARWAAGRLPTEQLRQEPQGRLPAPATPPGATNHPGQGAAQTAQSAQSTPGQSPATAAAAPLPGAAAATGSNAMLAGGTAPSTPANTAQPLANSPSSAGMPNPQPGNTLPPASVNESSPPQPNSTPGMTPQSAGNSPAQSLPGQSTTPSPQPAGMQTSPQNPAATPSASANTATPAGPAPANVATLPQGTPGASAQAIGPQASPTGPTSQNPSPQNAPTASPEAARQTTGGFSPPLLRQGNLVYEAFPPRNAWTAQNGELQGTAAAPASPSSAPPSLLANAPREQPGQPNLTLPPEPSREQAVSAKPGPGGPLNLAESTRDNGRSQALAIAAPTSTGTAEKSQAPGLAPGPSGIPRDIAPLVQQQLDGLANQNYAWQGQIWPGQNLWWEIGEDPESRRAGDEDGKRWQTRLKLSLPMLGDVDARISLQGSGQISLRVVASDAASATQLQEGLAELRQQFEAAGLSTGQMRVDHEPLPQAESAA